MLYHPRNPQKKRPVHVRQTQAARRLAHNGAMLPEGCKREELEAVSNLRNLSAPQIKEILATLWAFRLLGWQEADVSYFSYTEIVAIVRNGTERPADTIDIIPAWFTKSRSPEELARFRYAA